MDFDTIKDRLASQGYSAATAYARIAHDILITAIKEAGFHDHLTVKGGVAMNGLTDIARRATMDMDVDLLHYPLTNEAIRKLVSALNRVAPCRVRINGAIETLHHQEYKGKRVNLSLVDENGRTIVTKIDVGVHTRTEVEQQDFAFRVVTNDQSVSLLMNSKEQIFVEKLKSLLRLGGASTRFKDVFDMCFLSSRIDSLIVKAYLRIYVFDDKGMRENNIADILSRLNRVFTNQTFIRGFKKPTVAWLDVPPETATSSIINFIASLEDRP